MRGGIALENRVQAVGRSRASPLRCKVLYYTANPAIKSVLLCVERNKWRKNVASSRKKYGRTPSNILVLKECRASADATNARFRLHSYTSHRHTAQAMGAHDRLKHTVSAILRHDLHF